MKFCPNCGAPVEEGHKFCAACGEKLSASDMPTEPVYTDDPALLSNPVLNQSPGFDAPAAKAEKVPELTLEPDLWGMPTAAQPAEPAAPAAAAVAASAAAAAEAPSYASVMEGVQYDNDLRREQEERRKHREEELRRLEEARREREAQAAQNPAPDNVPDGYTMSQPEYVPAEEEVPQLPDETLMLAWSIILTSLCSICGLVGLVKTIKARKAPTLGLKTKLLSSAKVWLIIGTAFRVMTLLGGLFS